MFAFFNFLCLAIGLAGFAVSSHFSNSIGPRNNTGPTQTNEDWQSVIWQNNGKALSETWVGRTAINVGDKTGEGLYHEVYNYLMDRCRGENHDCDWDDLMHTVYTHAIAPTFPHVIESYFIMEAYGTWTNWDIRQQLFEQMARTCQQLTSTAENCYTVPDHGVFCNMGDFVNINYPDKDGRPNYLRLKFWSPPVFNVFKCCRSLNKMDEAADASKDNLSKVMGKDYSRDSKCLIAFQTTCGECGSKCDECGKQCKDVCPNHKCGLEVSV